MEDIKDYSTTDRARFEEMPKYQRLDEVFKFEHPYPEIKVTPEIRQEGYEKFVTTDDHLMHITGIAKDQNGRHRRRKRYATSNITSPKGLKRFLERDTTYNLIEDPAVSLSLDLIVKYYEMNQSISEASEQIEQGERLFNAAMRRMYADRNFYPDANSTMRLSFGTVGGYTPFDGTTYDYYTTVKGIFEKVKEHAGDIDFAVQPELLNLLSSGDFGRYANAQGDMNVCFISNNDITGGNSGSAMFNAKGELLGLAFDGNWEAMSSDIVFEPDLQRCIGVDVRYMLFIMEKYGKAGNLVQELKIAR